MPHCAIGADVITGFPGETEDDFTETVQFIQSLDISYLHVFTYSERDATKALEITPVVPMAVRHRRNKILRNISYVKMEKLYPAAQWRNKKRFYLKKNEHAGMMKGYTDNYIRIAVPYKKEWINCVVDWKI